MHKLRRERNNCFCIIDVNVKTELNWLLTRWLLFVSGYQRQTTPNGHGNGNGNAVRDPISPSHNDSSDYKYGKLDIWFDNKLN